MRSLLLAQPGVFDAQVSFAEGRAWVTFDPSQTSAEALAQAVSAYYPARVLEVGPVLGP